MGSGGRGDSVWGVGMTTCTDPSLLVTDSDCAGDLKATSDFQGHKQGTHGLVSLFVVLEGSEF